LDFGFRDPHVLESFPIKDVHQTPLIYQGLHNRKISTSTIMTIGSSYAGSMTLKSSYVKSIEGILDRAMAEVEFTD